MNFKYKKYCKIYLLITLVTSVFFVVSFLIFLNDLVPAKAVENSCSVEDATIQYNDTVEKYNNVANEVFEIQNEIDNSTQEIFNSQHRLLENKNELAECLKDDYINNKASLFFQALNIIDNFSEFVDTIDYLYRIECYKAQLVVNEMNFVSDYQQKVDELHKRKDKQDQLLNSMANYIQQAQDILADAKERFRSEEAEKHFLELEKQNCNIQSQPEKDILLPESRLFVTDLNGSWINGQASAYNAGENTATGERVTENSMGVSVLISRFPELKGKIIEIEYGGMSVFARVNDCGGLNGRDIDLQPGVFHAFGFASPYAWGVRSVNYRYL